MPLLLPLLAVGGFLAEAGGALATIAGVAMILLRIWTVISLITATFWFLCAYFAKEMFGWVLEVMINLASRALQLAGVEEPGHGLMDLIAQLPQVVIDLWNMLGLFDDLRATFAAYAINFALASLPLVGRLFRS